MEMANYGSTALAKKTCIIRPNKLAGLPVMGFLGAKSCQFIHFFHPDGIARRDQNQIVIIISCESTIAIDFSKVCSIQAQDTPGSGSKLFYINSWAMQL